MTEAKLRAPSLKSTGNEFRLQFVPSGMTRATASGPRTAFGSARKRSECDARAARPFHTHPWPRTVPQLREGASELAAGGDAPLPSGAVDRP